MQYKYSYQVNDDFIDDILRIDASVYHPSVQGTKSSLLNRYQANRESFVLAIDETQLIGYVGFFPVTNALSERMVKEHKTFDDNIRGEDILPSYTSEFDFDMFLISIAISPEYKGKGVGSELMRQCLAFIDGKRQSGSRIRHIYSYAFTDDGVRVLSKVGFTVIKTIQYPEQKTDVFFMRYTF